MGCGISTMNGNDTSSGQRRFNGRFRPQNIIASPIVNNNDNKYNYDKINKDDVGDQEAVKKEKRFNGEKLKEKKIVEDRKYQEESNERNVCINSENDRKLKEDNPCNNKENVGTNNEEDENNNNNRDDWFIGPGSPSFREYCTDYDSVDRSSMVDSNDYSESGENTKNSSDEDSTKPVNEKSRCSKKQEAEKKERRGQGGFRNAIYKGKARGGKRNILNFACYNSNSQSYAEGSFNKIVEKPT